MQMCVWVCPNFCLVLYMVELNSSKQNQQEGSSSSVF